MDFLGGTNPYAGLATPHSDFPSVLPWSEASDWIADAGPSEAVLGVDGTGSPLTADFDSESPHILVSAPTGRGKSGIARSIAVQRLIKGDLVVFLDIKQHSHRWARKLAPNVIYASTPTEIGGSLVNIGREVHRRNTVVANFDGPIEDAPVGPRITVVFEEMNASMDELKVLDKRLPDGDYTALRGMKDVSLMGRAVKVNLVSFAQMATYRDSGGSVVIENYDTRILVGYSPKTWQYLARDCGRAVTAPAEVGRGMVVQRGKARETQLLWLPEGDAEECVLSAPLAQRRARELSGTRRALPDIWKVAIGR